MYVLEAAYIIEGVTRRLACCQDSVSSDQNGESELRIAVGEM